MKVQVLGAGCTKCNQLFDDTKKALEQEGIEAELEKIEDLQMIASFGVIMTPALAIDGEVKSVGSVPKVSQIAQWLTAAKA